MPKLKVAVSEGGGVLVGAAAVRAGVSVEAFVVRGVEAALAAEGPLAPPEADGTLSVVFRPRVSGELRDRVRAEADRRGLSVNGFARAGLALVLLAERDVEVTGALAAARDLSHIRDRTLGNRGLSIADRAREERMRDVSRPGVAPEPPLMHEPGPPAVGPDPPQAFRPEPRVAPYQHPRPVWTEAEKRWSGYPPYESPRRRHVSQRAKLARFYGSLGRDRGDGLPPAPLGRETRNLAPKFKDVPSGLPPLVRPTGRLTYPDGSEY